MAAAIVQPVQEEASHVAMVPHRVVSATLRPLVVPLGYTASSRRTQPGPSIGYDSSTSSITLAATQSMVVMKVGEAVGMGWGLRPTTAAVETAVARLPHVVGSLLHCPEHRTHPGLPILHPTGTRPTLTMRLGICAHRVASDGALPAYLVTAHTRTCQFRSLFALFYRLADV
jgi:hypothetical protein